MSYEELKSQVKSFKRVKVLPESEEQEPSVRFFKVESEEQAEPEERAEPVQARVAEQVLALLS